MAKQQSPDTRTMYPKPKFLEVLHAIREEMSRDADYDVELFAEMTRSGERPRYGAERNIRGFKSRAPRDEGQSPPAPRTRTRKRAAR